ncbi:MAG: hypothetical protein ACRCUT_02835, partial [Spirochaetota bacterium]
LSGKDAAAIALENGYYDLSEFIKKAPSSKKEIVRKNEPAAVAPQPGSETVSPSEPPEKNKEQSPPLSIREFYPAHAGDSWSLKNVKNSVITFFYVLDANDEKAVIQCESKKGGTRVDYYKQIIIYENDKVKVSASGRNEILLQAPVRAGTKWFIERGSVIERVCISADEKVNFAGKEYTCAVTRDILPVKIPAGKKRGKAPAYKTAYEVHYHVYAQGIGYLGTKTAVFEKSGDVEHIPAFAEIPGWFLVRQRSAN